MTDNKQDRPKHTPKEYEWLPEAYKRDVHPHGDEAREQIRSALVEGEIKAIIRTPQGRRYPFPPVLWDKDALDEKVWPRFEDGRATFGIKTRDGEILVSGWIFVPGGALAELLARDKGEVISHATASGERLCREWLIYLMLKGKQPKTKNTVKLEALEKFAVSGLGFGRAWKAALKQSADPHGWSRGGRPRKSR